MVRKLIILVLSLIILVLTPAIISAWEFNGTAYDVNGTALNNTNVTVIMYATVNNSIAIVGYNYTQSNASGWFNLTVFENSSWFYQPVLRHSNTSTGTLDLIGQTLPYFPLAELSNGISTNFYLKQAGTINITAVNSSGSRIPFRYMVKDTILGYIIEESFTTAVNESNIYVPTNKNYSIMIFPDASMPVTYEFNNFTSTISYNFGTNDISNYNLTTRTVHKMFNLTMSYVNVSGVINASLLGLSGFSELKIIPYLLEPGNMIYMAQGALPHNMSSFQSGTDVYNLTTGDYNITLPGPVESTNLILFATAKNGTKYYGSFKNITLSYGTSNASYNFTLYGMLGNNTVNLSMHQASNYSEVTYASTQSYNFSLVNSSNNKTLSGVNAHVEVTVDYSDYNATEFTFMPSLPTSGAANFLIPLLNTTGVKEINIYTQSFSPKTVTTKTVAQILSNPNISMSAFSPGDIDGTDISSNLNVTIYISNSTCDVPYPPQECIITSSAFDSFSPLSAVIGGGKLNFRMGLTSAGIEVHYVNVDLLASGPPDALFDDSATQTTAGDFSSVLRFGSNGPKIYDYVLISMPYTEGSTLVAGVNESKDINMNIPTLYDEDWNTIWSVSTNGTSGSALGENYSHYSLKSSEWETLFSNTNCTNIESSLSSTTPCYKNLTYNRIWIRLPHFSGTQPNVSGTATNLTPTSDDSSSGSGGSSGGTSGFWRYVYSISEKQLNSNKSNYTKNVYVKSRLQFKINNSANTSFIGVIDLTTETATINTSNNQKFVLNIGESEKFDFTNDDYYDILVKINSIANNKANISVMQIYEKIVVIPNETTTDTSTDTSTVISDPTNVTDENSLAENKPGFDFKFNLNYLWIVLAVLALIVGVYFFFHYKTADKPKKIHRKIKVFDL
ncbi:hypothetical protein GOV12_03700 [Candidatus Pacearchaeota archaeon]|nr:hypothetical protein [Candidatus Pacearchaeota archaeon]